MTHPLLSAFEKYGVGHFYAEEVFNELVSIAREPAKTSILILEGPTGVGKSTVLEKAYKQIIKDNESEMQIDRSFLPAILTKVIMPSRGAFDWGTLYFAGLKEAKEVLIKYKKLPVDIDLIRPDLTTLKGSEKVLRYSFEECIKNRRIRIIFLDDAQHITRIEKGRKLMDQLEVVKSLADRTGALFVLAGTYQLTEFLKLSGQTNRRTEIIHYPRYHFEVDEEKEQFASVVKLFQDFNPIFGDMLERNIENLFARSVGCIGNLKDWLLRALRIAVQEDANGMSKAHLDRAAMEMNRCVQIAHEAIEGETRYADLFSGKAELYRLLNITENNNSQENKVVIEERGTEKPNIEEKNTEKPKKEKKRGRPGRKPHRDKTGIPVGIEA